MNHDSGARVETRVRDAQMLRRLMEHQRVSGRELARYAGTSPATISRLVNGKNLALKNKVAHSIAKRLDMPFDTLFVIETFYVSRDYAKHNAA